MSVTPIRKSVRSQITKRLLFTRNLMQQFYGARLKIDAENYLIILAKFVRHLNKNIMSCFRTLFS